MKHLCTCGFVTKSSATMRKHVLNALSSEQHVDVEWLLGRLVIRGYEEDETERANLRERLQAIGED